MTFDILHLFKTAARIVSSLTVAASWTFVFWPAGGKAWAAASACSAVVVSGLEELRIVAGRVNGGMDNYEGKTLLLAADIDMGDVLWTPIGTTTHPFEGTFDGQGHVISRLNVFAQGRETGNVAGLFGCVGSRGRVERLKVASGSVTLAEKSQPDAPCAVGGVVGWNDGQIVQCASQAEVLASLPGTMAGGIAGVNSSTGIIEDCYSHAKLFTSYSQPAAKILLGGIAANSGGIIRRTYVSASIGKASVVGGIYALSPLRDAVANSFYHVSPEGGGMLPGSVRVRGAALRGLLAPEGNKVWRFGRGDELPELNCFVTSDVILSEKENFLSMLKAHAGHFCNVLLQGRTFYRDGNWNTLCLPFAMPLLQGSPLEGAEVRELVDVRLVHRTLSLTFSRPLTSIRAGVPYMVRWEAGSPLQNPVFSHVELVSLETGLSSSFMEGRVQLVGTLSPVAIGESERGQVLFLGASNHFSVPSAAGRLNAFRAFLRLNEGVARGLRRVELVFE